ncbi:MAG TPA: tRNA (adenosine(37)-N6)-threonylcarbamoyltransferase complex dimerization subunit type 1 TsaB [Planctomycetota bacterium]|nr:tRNA (adenosine(37)-N6)-threonylcarbamoyltransferase complex dimerization subunit type 1 TsaB [Planctomycetota bacterium]
MNLPLALAVSGSNVTGDVPFSCALRLPDRLVEARSPAGSRGDLAALTAELCAAHAVRAEQIAEVRLDLGPGSYTGLRVAVTFVRFLQHFGAVPVLAVDSLALLANAAPAPARAGRRLLPVLDARRHRFHHASFRLDGDRLSPLAEPRAVPLAVVLAEAVAGDLFVVPEAVEVQIGAGLRDTGAGVHVARAIAAVDLFAPGLPFARCAPEALEPRYLMASYAED